MSTIYNAVRGRSNDVSFSLGINSNTYHLYFITCHFVLIESTNLVYIYTVNRGISLTEEGSIEDIESVMPDSQRATRKYNL